MIDTNLIPLHRRVARKRRVRMQCWIGTWVGYTGVLVAGALMIRAAVGGDVRGLEERLDVQTGQINVTTESLSGIEKVFQEAARELATSRAIGNQPDWSILLILLSDQLPDSMWIERCDLTPQKPQKVVGPTVVTRRGVAAAAPKPAAQVTERLGFVLTLVGQAATQSDVSRFVLGLEGTDLFDKVTLVETHNQPDPIGETIGFRVKCLLDTKGGGR